MPRAITPTVAASATMITIMRAAPMTGEIARSSDWDGIGVNKQSTAITPRGAVLRNDTGARDGRAPGRHGAELLGIKYYRLYT
ncbi:hypothetical protein JCM30237_06440 [Halolamina litorea]